MKAESGRVALWGGKATGLWSRFCRSTELQGGSPADGTLQVVENSLEQWPGGARERKAGPPGTRKMQGRVREEKDQSISQF